MNNYRIIDHQNKGLKFIAKSKEDIGIFKIGKDCDLNDVVIDKTGGVFIGSRVHFGHQVMLLTTSHPIYVFNGNERKKIIHVDKIEIANDVCIGSRALVLKGVKIGESSYISAGSVVNEDTCIGNYELWGGNPARFIRNLEPKREDYNS